MRASENHDVWRLIAPELTPRDFREPYSMNTTTLMRLSLVRRESGVPFRIVSDHRPPERNAAVGGARGSAHMSDPCHAVDIRVHGSRERFLVVAAAIKHGFRRIGIYQPTAGQLAQYGKNSGSVHLDDSPEHPQDVIWVRV